MDLKRNRISFCLILFFLFLSVKEVRGEEKSLQEPSQNDRLSQSYSELAKVLIDLKTEISDLRAEINSYRAVTSAELSSMRASLLREIHVAAETKPLSSRIASDTTSTQATVTSSVPPSPVQIAPTQQAAPSAPPPIAIVPTTAHP